MVVAKMKTLCASYDFLYKTVPEVCIWFMNHVSRQSHYVILTLYCAFVVNNTCLLRHNYVVLCMRSEQYVYCYVILALYCACVVNNMCTATSYLRCTAHA